MTATEATPLTRQHQGQLIPATGTYQIDKSHSTVEFIARHLMISKVRGRFDEFSGAVTIAEVPEESSVDVTIDAASVSTKEPQRDEHLRSADFFDVATYPVWHFASTTVAPAGDNHWKVTGDLTLHGTTKSVVLDVEFEGAEATPWGTTAIGFSASTEIDREEFGLTWNQAIEAGGVVVGKRIRIELGVEASAAAAAA
ncbi:MAG TPA: YceI family protein [Acidimicrobiales bacterium]|nr:YceI family protein [Acidimicrobiales bacterium]